MGISWPLVSQCEVSTFSILHDVLVKICATWLLTVYLHFQTMTSMIPMFLPSQTYELWGIAKVPILREASSSPCPLEFGINHHLGFIYIFNWNPKTHNLGSTLRLYYDDKPLGRFLPQLSRNLFGEREKIGAQPVGQDPSVSKSNRFHVDIFWLVSSLIWGIFHYRFL